MGLHDVGAEGAAARGVHGGQEAAGAPPADGAAAAGHVEEVVELCHGTFHVVVVVVVSATGTTAAAPNIIRILLSAAAEHGQLFDGTTAVAAAARLLVRAGGRGAHLVEGVDEVAARTIGAEADAVVGAAHVRLVLGVAVHCTQFSRTMGKLALLPVLADTVLLKYRSSS